MKGVESNAARNRGRVGGGGEEGSRWRRVCGRWSEVRMCGIR